MSLGGNLIPVENLAESLRVALDAGARRVLLPMASVKDILTIPGELFAKFQTSFYADPADAVFKALGMDTSWPWSLTESLLLADRPTCITVPS